MEKPVVPAVHINSGMELHRVPTSLTYQPPKMDDGWEVVELSALNGPNPDVGEASYCKAIEEYLRDHSTPHPKTGEEFWPDKLFHHLFGYKEVHQVVRELHAKDGAEDDAPEPAATYWTRIICPGEEDADLAASRKVLALLLLAEQAHLIHEFISTGINDSKLPLEKSHRVFGLVWKKRRNQTEMFLKNQWRLLVPFLGPPADASKPGRVVMRREDICPWYKITQRPKESGSGPQLQQSGGYATVYQIDVHPWQHGFQQTLQESTERSNIFALKVLKEESKKTFEQEAEMLHRFGGQTQHIVSLLTTIQREKEDGEEYMFLLPWADADLAGYWERAKRPHSHECYKWITEQCYGLAHAISIIHEAPGCIHEDGSQLYGRHGDLKPENILWFKRGGRGILAISDMGLTEVHRNTSRSNIRGAGLPATPDYRPPECDMFGKQGSVSRSFDIWTLGCVFLEYIIWILEGKKGVKKFKADRMSPYLGTNVHNSTFYDVLVLDDDQYAFKIKDSVAQRIIDLHNHEHCSQFIHEWLDLIQQRMLVVQSSEPLVDRIKAPDLVARMAAIRDLCHKDESTCLIPQIQEVVRELHLHNPVQAPLSDEALKSVGKGVMKRMGHIEGKVKTMRPI